MSRPTSLDEITEDRLLRSKRGLHFSDCPFELERPFSDAVAALRDENDFLYTAFGKQRELHPHVRKGLAYWLFETTLVYLVFRRWLDKGHPVQWERHYPDRRRAADLVLSKRQVGVAAQTVIEAKWWNRNSQSTLDGIAGDVRKLRNWRTAQNRVVLTFWYSPIGDWEHDRLAVSRGCKRMKLNEKPLFVAAFPTHVPHKNKGSAYYFAILALDANV